MRECPISAAKSFTTCRMMQCWHCCLCRRWALWAGCQVLPVAVSLNPDLLHTMNDTDIPAAHTAGVAWLDEYQPEQRQSPELAALLRAIQRQGAQEVADQLQLAEGLSAAHRQQSAVELRHEPWHAVDIDHATDLAGRDTLLVSLDVMLVHAMVPLAAALSPQSKREAQARVLQVVSHGGGAAAAGDDAAAAAQTISSIQVSSLQDTRPLERVHALACSCAAEMIGHVHSRVPVAAEVILPLWTCGSCCPCRLDF
jgi:hypothetical protein